MTLDPASAERAITRRTVALLPVHLYGQPADMASLAALASRKGLALVEDCCQAHLATCGGQPVGTFGAAGAFSFYPTKNLGALGDGGAVITRDPALAERIRRLRNGGQAGRYDHVEPGVNSRLDDLQAAVLRARLPLLRRRTAERRALASEYRARLERHAAVNVPMEMDSWTRVSSLSGQIADGDLSCRLTSEQPASKHSCIIQSPCLSRPHSHRRTPLTARTRFMRPARCCRCRCTRGCRWIPFAPSPMPYERTLFESVDHRGRGFHRVAPRGDPPERGTRSRHHRQSVHRLDSQRQPPEIPDAVQVRHRHVDQRAAARRADRSQRRDLPFRGRGGRQADRRTAGAHDRDQRARHRSGAEAREQEEEEGRHRLDVRGVRQERWTCPSARMPTS